MLANQGHSLNEGDSKEMVEARTRFLNNNFYNILRQKILSLILTLSKNNNSLSFIDVACGEGYYTNYIHKSLVDNLPTLVSTYGVDISKNAINAASSFKNILKLQEINYCVGNLDYLPFLDHTFDILLNCFAPINEKEFHRILKTSGYFIRVLPGKYHLLELKEFLYKDVFLNEPKEDKIEGFLFENSIEVDDTISLNNQQIQDLFTMTPYYYKTSYEAKDRLKKLEQLTTKISFIIKVYRKDN